MRFVSVLWRFSRPHTIIGTIVGIYTLYLLVCGAHHTSCVSYLLMALLIGITCNIFIVGINQIADVPIDRINKPYLPIPSGDLTVEQARIIVYTAIGISLSVALCVSPYLFIIIALSAGMGWAYSMPPLYLKRHHLTAALAITFVRGILLNAGGFMVFQYLVHGTLHMPGDVKLLTMFIVIFSIVIAWFKDLPDMKGDAKFNIRTFAILYSPRTALILGHVLVGSAYLVTMGIQYVEGRASGFSSTDTQVLFYGHIVLFGLFLINAFTIRLHDPLSVRTFYMRFWYFFFGEYLLYILAYTV